MVRLATSKTWPRSEPTLSSVCLSILVVLQHANTDTACRGIPFPEGSETPTTRRLSLGWWWERKCSCRHRPLPIYIVSSRPLDSFFGHGGCVHHLEVVRNLKENNHLTNSRQQAVTVPVSFGLFIRNEVRAYLNNFKNLAEYYSTDILPWFRSWKSRAHCCLFAQGKKQSLNSL